MSRDAFGLFGVKPPAVHDFVERLTSVVAALPSYAAAHGADALSRDVMMSRIDAAAGALQSAGGR
jgi:serine/threonine-protein kinase HipA